jgi:hypothetical protein
LNNGKKGFQPLSIMQSGFYTPANGRALVEMVVQNKPAVAAGQNRDMLKLFQTNQVNEKVVTLQPAETHAMVSLKNGSKRKEEFPFGQGFLSQSSRFLSLNPSILSVDFFAGNQKTRTLQP